MDSKTKILALRRNYGKMTKDYIIITTTDDVFYVSLEREKVEEVLREFETGKEININF